jgi:hypothetical protein
LTGEGLNSSINTCQRARKSAATTGPTMKPFIPKIAKPPRVESRTT